MIVRARECGATAGRGEPVLTRVEVASMDNVFLLDRQLVPTHCNLRFTVIREQFCRFTFATGHAFAP